LDCQAHGHVVASRQRSTASTLTIGHRRDCPHRTPLSPTKAPPKASVEHNILAVRESRVGMDDSERYVVHPIGIVRSTLRAVADAPNQAFEGAPEALLEIDPAFAEALHRVEPGDELIVVTWLHQADRGRSLAAAAGAA
jgi:hypothetical protein